VGLCYDFEKKKIIPPFPFWVIEESRSPSDGVHVKNKKNKREDERIKNKM
jgi:hypothetical protein